MNTASDLMAEQSALNTVGHLIGGKPVQDAQRSQPVYDPATGRVTRQVGLPRAPRC